MTYLIQRGKQIVFNTSSLTGLVAFDYMYEIEFEGLALTNSLTKMLKIKEDIGAINYTPLSFLLFDDPYLKITVCSPCARTTKQRNSIIEEIKLIAENKIPLKCSSNIEDFINHVPQADLKTDFWWAIDSDYMFWVTGDGSFTKAFRQFFNS